MRRISWLSLPMVAVLSISGLTACSSGDDSAKESVRIGVNIELSGSSAGQGAAYSRALKIAADKINNSGELGDREIELVERDNKSDPNEAADVAGRLIDSEDVVAMVGPGTTPTTMSAIDVAEKSNVPLISMGSSNGIVAPLDQRRSIFKTPADAETVADVIAADLTRFNTKKVAFLAIDNAYGQAGLDAFTHKADAGEITLTAEEKFKDSDQDLSEYVDTLMNSNPDVIVVWATSPHAGRAAKAIKAAEFSGQVYFDAGAGAELFLSEAGTDAEGMYMVHPSILAVGREPATSPSTQAQREFYAEFSQEYGGFSGFASYAADALGLIAAAIVKADSTKPAKIRDALETVKYDGLTGTFSFSAENHGGVSKDALAVLTVRRGSWVPAQ